MGKTEHAQRVAQILGNAVRDPLATGEPTFKGIAKTLYQCWPTEPIALTRWLIRPAQGFPFLQCETPPLPMSKGQLVFVLAPRGWQVAGVCQRTDGKSTPVNFNEVAID